MLLIQRALACLVLMLFVSLSAVAQPGNVPRYQFGIGAGALIYQGDLSPERLGAYKTPRLSVNLMASRILSPSFSVRANLLFGGLRAADSNYVDPEWRRHRNFRFRTSVVEISITPEWNILGRNYQERGFAPYLFAGIGYSFLNIKRDHSGYDAAYFGEDSPLTAALAEDAAVEPPRGILHIPVGVGLRYNFSDRLGVQAESAYRIFSTDYLDGYSKAANPELGDRYHGHSLSLLFRLGKRNTLDCPPALGY